MESIISKKLPLITIGSILVMIAFFVFTCISLIQYNNGFSFFNNWISDLGNMDKNPSGYLYFNVGCIITGIAVIFSSIAMEKCKLFQPEPKRKSMILQICGYIMGFAIIMIGLFPEDSGPFHYIFAGIFFILLLLFTMIASIILKNSNRAITGFSLYAIIAIIIEIIFLSVNVVGLEIPILEWLTVICGIIWFGFFGYNIYKAKAC